jgi:hypothetical protein
MHTVRVREAETNAVTPGSSVTPATKKRLTEAIVADHAKTSVTVVAIDGMAGIGKSTLAVHMAHRIGSEFPDGQIFLRLHAHDPYEEPVDPATVLGRLLRVTRSASASLPADYFQPGTLEMQAALWHEETAKRRLLIISDDAASQDQPLIPGAPECLVLITSRRRLHPYLRKLRK